MGTEASTRPDAIRIRGISLRYASVYPSVPLILMRAWSPTAESTEALRKIVVVPTVTSAKAKWTSSPFEYATRLALTKIRSEDKVKLTHASAAASLPVLAKVTVAERMSAGVTRVRATAIAADGMFGALTRTGHVVIFGGRRNPFALV